MALASIWSQYAGHKLEPMLTFNGLSKLLVHHIPIVWMIGQDGVFERWGPVAVQPVNLKNLLGPGDSLRLYVEPPVTELPCTFSKLQQANAFTHLTQ
ncbi:hypothetical protein C7451_101172 [Blastomonas natatoria]|uniref:Uncharacterized protein n=1 Tax=Blastomonas natatoria TaxID=34015 RepID=A0A2V3VC08_9SPHN|nr:hypothetical protein C7451_101172 [Blastomonas natatoria]